MDTYSSAQVERIFSGRLSAQHLQYWDNEDLLRPSYYRDGHRQLRARRSHRGKGFRRRYTYEDLVKIKLFLYIYDELKVRKVKKALRTTAEVIRVLRRETQETCPAASRIVFLAHEVYFLQDGGHALCLTRDGELAMTQLLTDHVLGEVKGRVAVVGTSPHGKPRSRASTAYQSSAL